jgi:hypothetical protein
MQQAEGVGTDNQVAVVHEIGGENAVVNATALDLPVLRDADYAALVFFQVHKALPRVILLEVEPLIDTVEKRGLQNDNCHDR